MTRSHTYAFFTSVLLFFIFSTATAQELTNEIDTSVEASDTTSTERKKQYFELRVGTDLSKLIRTAFEDGYSGFELNADLRFKKNYFLAAEIGNRTVETIFPNIENTTSGSYIKAGFNYNAYENWFGMNNLIYAGLRAGFSTFSQELNNFTIYTTDPLFGDDTRVVNQEFNGLNATFLEFQAGLQVELLANIYVGIQVQLKRSITVKEPEGFTNLFIPGFGKTTEDSSFGVGYGYTLSYLIPIYRR